MRSPRCLEKAMIPSTLSRSLRLELSCGQFRAEIDLLKLLGFGSGLVSKASGTKWLVRLSKLGENVETQPEFTLV